MVNSPNYKRTYNRIIRHRHLLFGVTILSFVKEYSGNEDTKIDPMIKEYSVIPFLL